MSVSKLQREDTEDRFRTRPSASWRAGPRGITTRRLAKEVDANHGLVHYYFGSIENLLVRVLERFTERLIERQRRMYTSDAPFIEKWRTAMHYLDADRDYQRIWFELQALCLDQAGASRSGGTSTPSGGPCFGRRLRAAGALRAPHPARRARGLVVTFNEGISSNACRGSSGPAELLEWIDAWLMEKEARPHSQ